ncbi:MFS transporter [Streptomyces sp. cf124]|uniref:MFS transporter n=1 Tax=Streptomyces sp. cf124 TaxID=1761903 RepID=UPI000B86A9A7|nr:MFS transporter [Streptomyces sp. cf124]
MLCTGLFLIGLDVTVMNVALPSLQLDLDPGPQGLLWIADGYTLALACCVLAAGVWSDTHGRRRAFILGLALCGTASVGGGLATGTGQVVAARLAMGCGAALLMPSTLSLITVVFPDLAARRRPWRCGRAWRASGPWAGRSSAACWWSITAGGPDSGSTYPW